MALAVTSLTNGSVAPGVNLTAYTTASISPAGGSLLILASGAYDGSGTQDFTISTVASPGLTLATGWTKQESTGAGSADKGDAEVWTAVCGATPGSGAIVVTFTAGAAGLGGAAWAVDQATGQDASTPVWTTDLNNASSATPTLVFSTAQSASNLFYMISVVLLGAAGSVTQTPNESPTPWTALDNLQSSTATNNGVALLATVSPDATNLNGAVSLGGTSHSWATIGLELNAAAGGVSVSLPAAAVALAAPPAAPQFPASASLPAAQLALAAPLVTPAGSGAATVALPAAQLALAAPALSPGSPPAAGAARQQGDSDRPGLLRKPFLW